MDCYVSYAHHTHHRFDLQLYVGTDRGEAFLAICEHDIGEGRSTYTYSIQVWVNGKLTTTATY